MSNWVFVKKLENVRKHRDIKPFTAEKRRNYLVFEPNYHAETFFTEHLLAIELNKTEIPRNKAVYFGLSILKLNKILMYEIWYDNVKAKYGKKQSCVICIQTVSLYT